MSVIPDTENGEEAVLTTVEFSIAFVEEALSDPPVFQNPYKAEIMLGHCSYSWTFNEEDGYFGGQDGVPVVLVKEMEPEFRIKIMSTNELLQSEFNNGGGLCGA